MTLAAPDPTHVSPIEKGVSLGVSKPEEDVRAWFDEEIELWIMASSTCGGIDPETGCLSSGC
jgi:hypothetical protein